MPSWGNLYSMVVCLSMFALACSPGAPPNFNSPDGSSGFDQDGVPLSISFDLESPSNAETIEIKQDDVLSVKVSAKTTGNASTLDDFEVIWCVEYENSDYSSQNRRLCIADDFDCAPLEGFTDEDQSRVASLTGEAVHLQPVGEDDSSYDLNVRVKLIAVRE